MSPAGPLSSAIFDELENLRIETVASRAFTGVAVNLAAAFEHRFGQRGLDLLEPDSATPLANAAVLIVRDHLLDGSLPDTAKRLINRWQEEITASGGNKILTELDWIAAKTSDQLSFARWSRRFIDSLELVDDPQKGPNARPVEAVAESQEDETGVDLSGGEAEQGDNERAGRVDKAPVVSGEDDQQDMENCGNNDSENNASGSVIPFPQNKDQSVGL